MNIISEPFLKWPGGKRRVLQHILPLLPKTYKRYYEPFLGGGALFFAVNPHHATLSDNNHELMNCYIQVRDNPERVIKLLRTLQNTEENYYEIRSTEPKNDIERAARFMYLITLSFNGICRFNQRGQFNVPYGKKKHLLPCDETKILSASSNLQKTELRCIDFEQSVKNAGKGDLVYLDPPYTVAHGSNGFLRYNDKIFSWNDQLRLASLAKNLEKRGCQVIISNACHHSILDLFKGFKVQIITRSSIIAASSNFRKPIQECIFFNKESSPYVK